MTTKIYFLTVIMVIVSCTENGVDEVLPVSPVNLIGTVISANQIKLVWTDNSTNEKGFIVERKAGLGNYSEIGRTGVNETSFSDNSIITNTTHSYRVYSYNSTGSSLTYSNEINFGPPTISTREVSSINLNSAISGGSLINDNGSATTATGVVWSTSQNPTISLTSKTNDIPIGSIFESSITGLNSNSTYFLRAYATNLLGTGYGNEIAFKTLECSNSVSDSKLNSVDQLKLQSDIIAIDTYLESNSLTAIKDPTGIRYIIAVQGNGVKPCLENYITVKYLGKFLSDGSQFNSPTGNVTFNLSSMILGWQIAFPKIQSGTKFILYIPSGYAYGASGAGGVIPPNANLIFEIDYIQ